MKLEIRGDLKGIMDALEEEFGMSPEDMLLQTIYLNFPDLFEQLKDVNRQEIFLQFDKMTWGWITRLTDEHKIPHRHMLIRALLGLKPQLEGGT